MKSDTIVYDYFLAIDQGGHASRATLYNCQGEALFTTKTPIKTNRSMVSGIEYIEHNIVELKQSIQSVIFECKNYLGDVSHIKVKAGFATQRSTIVCWNYITGEILSEAISWQDTRASSFVTLFETNNTVIKSKTGLFLSAHYGFSKINWCLNQLESVKQANTKQQLCIAPLASYLLYSCVEGKKCLVDPANAARTLLLNKDSLTWDEELLELFSIPKNILPTCVTSKYEYGQLLNWEGQCDVALCTGDQSAAVLSQGISSPDEFTVNIGSGAFILNINNKSESPTRILSGSIYTDSGKNITAWEGTVNGAGVALDWFQAQNSDCDVYNELPVWLAQNNKNIPLFINGISGVGSPFWLPALKSRFIGEADISCCAIAVIESIVFLITVNIILMVVEPNNSIKISGGISVLDGLCQKLADLSQMDVIRLENKEATLSGVMFLLSDLKIVSKSNNNKTFNSNLNPPLLRRFKQWQEEMINE